MGHYMVAKFFQWRVQDITLWIFGGVMNTDEHANKPIREEMFVTLAGPMQHIIIYLFLLLLSYFNIFPPSILQIMFDYNFIILLFNLLPIWPLDGGKVLYFTLSFFRPFREAYYFIIIFSMILTLCLLIFQMVVYPFTLSAFFIMIFLYMENRSEWKTRYYVFIRFLLHRYENKEELKGSTPISVKNDVSLMKVFTLFKRGRKHYIYVHFPLNNRVVVDERECLKVYFHEKKYKQTIGSVVNK